MTTPAEAHTQDCINAFYSDGGQSGCICGAERCTWAIRCDGEADHSGAHHSKDRFRSTPAEALREALEHVLDVWAAPSPEEFARLHRVLTGHDSCSPHEHITEPDTTGDPLSCWCRPYRDNDEPQVIIHRKEGEA